MFSNFLKFLAPPFQNPAYATALVTPVCLTQRPIETYFDQKIFNFWFKPPPPLATAWLRNCSQLIF